MRKILFALIVSLFLIQIISAGISDTISEKPNLKQELLSKDIKISDSANKYPAINIKTWWGLPLVSKDVMDIVLTSHTETCGINCISGGHTKLYEDGVLFSGFDFYTMLEDGTRIKQPIRNYQVYIKTDESEIDVNDYQWVCEETGKININGTKETKCENKIVGTHKQKKPLWEEYNLGDIVPAGEYDWELRGEKKPTRTVDFIPIVGDNNKISSWATWGLIGECYQESANVSTTCGGLNTGTYNWTATGVPDTAPNLAYDGNWITRASASSTNYLSIYINYSVPSGAYPLNTSLWEMSYDVTPVITNYTIPTSCWNANILQFKVVSFQDAGPNSYINATCFGGGIWNAIEFQTGGNTFQFGEEAMIWNGTGGLVTLNSPTDDYISPTNSVNFNCSATVTGGATLTNMSLWHNATGTWERNQSVDAFGLPTYQNVTSTFSQTSSETGRFGFQIQIGSDPIALYSVVRISGSTPTTAYLRDNSNNIIATATFVGDIATFSTQQTLNASTYYRIDTNAGGSSYTTKYEDSGTLPQSKLGFSYTNGTLDNTLVSSFAGFQSLLVGNFTASTTQVFTTPITNPTLWTCEACDSDGDCGFASENRTVSVDTIAPSITLSRPATIEDIGYAGGNQTLNWSITDTNLDSIWYNYNGTNITLYGATNSTTFLIDGSDRNLTFWANDSVGNVNSTTRSWDYNVFVNSQTYNTTTYETKSEKFSVNITKRDGLSLTNPKLIYEGVSYTASSITSGNEIELYRTIDIPTGVNTNSFYFNFTLDKEYSTTNTTQSTLIINFGLCNGTLTVPFINYTFKDEIDLTSLNGTINTELSYYLGSGTTNKTFSFLNASNNPSYAFCSTPPEQNINIIGYNQYSSTDYPQRRYDFDSLLTNTTTNKILYLLGLTNGIYAQFQITDTVSGNAIPDVSVTVSRSISGTSTTIATDMSDDSGLAIFFLSSDYTHTILFEHPDYETLSQNIQPTNADVYNVFLTPLSGSTAGNFTGYNQTEITQDLNYTILPKDFNLNNDTTYTFSFDIESTISLNGYMNLTFSNGTNILETGSGTDFTISKNLNTGNNTYVKGYFKLVSANETYEFTRVWSIGNYNTGDFSLWSWLKEWQFQSDGGDMIKFIQIIIVLASLLGTFFVLYTLPGGDIIDSSVAGILGGIAVMWIFSLAGWLTLTGIENVWLAKYTIALLFTLTGGLWIVWSFTSR